MPPNAYGKWLVRLAVLAVLLRVAMLSWAEFQPDRFDFPDSHRYVQVARNIAEGRGPIDSDSVRAGTDPVYPLLLSVGPFIGVQSDAGMMRLGRIINALAGIISVLLLASLARRLVGEQAAIVAAAILAIDPILLFFNALVLTEICYTAALLGALLCIVRLGTTLDGRKPQRAAFRDAVDAGLLLGFGVAIRSSALFLPLLLIPAVWSYAQGVNTPSKTRRPVVMTFFTIGVLLALAPTTIRNANLFGRFVPVRTGAGASMMESLGPWADGAPGMDRIQYPEFPEDANEVERDRICLRAAMTWAAENPSKTISLAFSKLLRTWSITTHAAGHASPLHLLVCCLTVAPVYAFALAGLWMLRRRRRLLMLLLAPALYFTLIHMIFVGSVRYRVPVMPLVFIAAAVAIVETWRRMHRRPTP